MAEKSSVSANVESREAPEAELERPASGGTVTRGRAWSTPFVVLGGVAAVVWAVVALLAAVALLVWWLA